MNTNSKTRIHYGNRCCQWKMPIYDVLECACRPSIVSIIMRDTWIDMFAAIVQDKPTMLMICVCFFCLFFLFERLTSGISMQYPQNHKKDKKILNRFDKIVEGYLRHRPREPLHSDKVAEKKYQFHRLDHRRLINNIFVPDCVPYPIFYVKLPSRLCVFVRHIYHDFPLTIACHFYTQYIFRILSVRAQLPIRFNRANQSTSLANR